jgi:hypothetical protein
MNSPVEKSFQVVKQREKGFRSEKGNRFFTIPVTADPMTALVQPAASEAVT